jgi:alkylation response protein AidB-like acyl-CoA dehydrogenase
MDLELTDEQRWLHESVDTLLARQWPAPEQVLGEATLEQRRRVWADLVEFGALSIGGEDGIGAVEACLIARALGAHLAAAPFIDTAAVRLAAGASFGSLLEPDATVTLGALEPGSRWAFEEPTTSIRRTATDRFALIGEKVAVEQADLAEVLVVIAALEGDPALAFLDPGHPSVTIEPRTSFDPVLTMSAVRFEGAPASAVTGPAAREALERLVSAGALLAAAEAIGAAERILDVACRYAAERRQFGRAIGSFQAVRHLLADMYVRCASGWSAILYAAAAFDGGAQETAQTVSIAKAYVSRGAREVAHGAMQVFGGIAFTAEHPAHRFLRRIIVREQQFGDAAHHERALGAALMVAAEGTRGTARRAAATEAARA